MASLDRSSPLPLWAQLAVDLRRRLLEGEFKDRFPTDEELHETYDVSRQTVREAVRQLTQDGLVVRQRGRGSTVSPPVLEQPLHSFYSLASTVRAGGIEERSEVLAFECRSVDSEVARRLDLGDDRVAVYVERLRFAGGEPIAWDRSWLRMDLASGLIGADLSSGSLYDLLALRCSVRITSGSERIRPVVPSAPERKLLQLAPQLAAFSIEREAFVEQTPLEWRRTLIRGDRYSLLAQWPGGLAPHPNSLT
ncbi:MAG: GntR family transcriptional regulator [Acidimicrobiales bacterium]